MSYSRIKILSGVITIFAFIFFSVFFLPKFSKADLTIPLQDSDITAETIPENPEPYQDVNINLTSYSVDLTKAQIEWQNSGKVIQSGIGKTSYSFKALGPNSSVIFSVIITPSGSLDSVTKQIVVTPSEIDVLWEAVDGYTPPFYKGKSFVSPEGTIKVVAIPNTNTIKSGKGSISYAWTLGDNAVQNASGYNKDSYTFANNVLDDSENVSVVASSVDGTYNATKSVTVPITSPKIIFYKKSPTEGVQYSNALIDDTFMSEDEFTVVAEPYFLPMKDKVDAFTFAWKINGDDIATPTKKTELTIRPADRGGYATIGVAMSNLNSFLQKVTGQLRITL